MAECSRCPSWRSNPIWSRLSPQLGSCISIGGESHAFTISLVDRWHCCCSTHCLSDLVLLPTPNSQRCTDAKIAAGKEAEVAGSNTKVNAKSAKQSRAAFCASLKNFVLTQPLRFSPSSSAYQHQDLSLRQHGGRGVGEVEPSRVALSPRGSVEL